MQGDEIRDVVEWRKRERFASDVSNQKEMVPDEARRSQRTKMKETSKYRLLTPLVGALEGETDGVLEGERDGTFVGCFDGLDEGELVGTCDGLADGDWLGLGVISGKSSSITGLIDGDGVGLGVFAFVGLGVIGTGKSLSPCF